MTIGVLGGSFCPPTIAHIELSRKCIQEGLCDKVIWVPVNDAYPKKTNIHSKHRVEMVKIALQDEPDIKYSLHEMNFDKMVYTFDSLKFLQSLYPDDKFLFIAGADKMSYRWFQSKRLLEDFGYIVINRDGLDCNSIIDNSKNLSIYKNKIKILNYDANISSTIVREELRNLGFSCLIKPKVLEYIKKNNLFDLKQ